MKFIPMLIAVTMVSFFVVTGCNDASNKDAIKEWKRDRIAENEKNYAERLEFKRKNNEALNEMAKEMEKNVREAGRKAHSAGISEVANPETESHYRRAWLEGYMERKAGKK